MVPPRIATEARTGLCNDRSAELDRLLRAVRRSPETVLIEGEAGSGKSRLVQELLRHPSMDDQPVLEGVCPPMRVPLPYGPVIEAVRRGAGRLDTRGFSPLVGSLRELLPELAGLPVSTCSVTEESVRRSRIFRAFRELLVQLGPAVVVIEDVHRSDRETWDLLQYLCSEPPPGVVLVLTCRRPSGSLPGNYSALKVGTRIRLEPMDAAQVGRLAAHVLGTPGVPEDFAAELHARSAGNPLWVQEVARGVRALRPTALTPSLLDDIETPSLLLDAVQDLLTASGRAATAVIRAAAVLGEPATEQDLGHVAGLPVRRVPSAVVRAIGTGGLYERTPGHYGPRHHLAAQAVRTTIPGPLRTRLHARAAELLAQCSDCRPARLAHHYRQSGDAAAWVRHTLTAVDQEMGAGDATVAVALLERALTETALPAHARDLFAVRLSRAVLDGITSAGTIDHLRSILRQDCLSSVARGEVRLNLGRWLINQAGELEAGRTEIEAAVTDLRERPELAARGMAALALPSFGTGPVETHMHWLHRAECALSDSADAETIAAVHTNRLSARMLMGDPRVWSDIAELERTLPSTTQRTRAYFNLADSATWNGHYDRAHAFLVEGRKLSGGKETFLSMLGDGTSLRLSAATGRWADLPHAADRVIALAGEREFLAADAWLATGWLSLWQGARAAAVHHFDAALRTAPHNVPVVASARAGRASALLTQGRTAAACWEADQALSRLREKGNWIWGAELVPIAVRAFVRGNRTDDATELLDEFGSGLTGKEAPLATAAAHAGHGALAQASGAVSAAAAHYVRAARHYEKLPHPAAAAAAYEAAAHCFTDADDRMAAAAQLSAALALYTALGTTHDIARCQRHLRQHEGSRRGRKGYGQELSPREKEVATLAGQGMTNPQIAELLVLSCRTVEQHVARALRKLNLGSRVAFADHPLTPTGDPEENPLLTDALLSASQEHDA